MQALPGDCVKERTPGCQNGESCNFCHLPHPGRRRPGKSRRGRLKKVAESLNLEAINANAPQGAGQREEGFESRGLAYIHFLVQKKVRDQGNAAAAGAGDAAAAAPESFTDSTGVEAASSFDAMAAGSSEPPPDTTSSSWWPYGDMRVSKLSL
eukprot:TRINITY_DN18123_c0_g1_i3.p1 TRINITY_DN18123_c0_g1~~TRINITY_DN18123_c0_g1_i3.p1  ORF type:complete len:153 (+),score=33.26 TRINITY_DN18123_c0_g1_i3:83-541(+)